MSPSICRWVIQFAAVQYSLPLGVQFAARGGCLPLERGGVWFGVGLLKIPSFVSGLAMDYWKSFFCVWFGDGLLKVLFCVSGFAMDYWESHLLGLVWQWIIQNPILCV